MFLRLLRKEILNSSMCIGVDLARALCTGACILCIFKIRLRLLNKETLNSTMCINVCGLLSLSPFPSHGFAFLVASPSCAWHFAFCKFDQCSFCAFGVGGPAVVADRIWLRRVIVSISMDHKDTEKVMNYFLALTNLPVGENKKMNF